MSAIPQQIGKYVVSGVIGRGGMGVVYRGTDPLLQRPVAIKVLHDPSLAEGEMQQRFLQEARAAANLRHENIVTIYEVGQQDGFTYVAMEYVSGETLYAVVRRGKRLPAREVLGWIDQICAGLALAHSRGIVHRDVKPANLVVDEHGALRILDFGIARVEGSTMTAAGDLIGTLHYMSPEQVQGEHVDYRSDIFAVGATAYELLTGQQAFPGNAAAAIQRILNVEPPAPSSVRPDLPPELDGIIARALAKDPTRRFGDLREMQRQIRGVQARLDTTDTIIGRPVGVPVAAEATLVVKRDVPPASSHEFRAVLFTGAAEEPQQPVTSSNESAPPETDVEQRPARFALRTSAVALIGVVVIGATLGLLSGSIGPWLAEPEVVRPPNDLAVLIERATAPHFAEETRRQVELNYGAGALESGIRVETTLDPDLQRAAVAAVATGVAGLGGVEGALVAIENETGAIRVFVGGSERDTLNRARSRRRIGSLFWPVAISAAIDRGYTTVSPFEDQPVEFSFPGAPPFSPRNDDGKYRGRITLREALESSRNVVAARLVFDLGRQPVVNYARKLGLAVDDQRERTLAAGELEATLVEITSAYATIANRGVRVEPHGVASVIGVDGHIFEQSVPAAQDGIRADTAFIVTDLLSGAISRGQFTSARALNWTLAGQSGTVADATDGWFVGFDPNLTVGVWVGYDDGRPMQSKEAGRSAALQIWTEFMSAYISTRGDRSNPPDFNAPDNIVLVSVGGAIEPFINGTQPVNPGTDGR